MGEVLAPRRRAQTYEWIVKRPSKKEIREAVEKLKSVEGGGGPVNPDEPKVGNKLPEKKSSQRIRKQGV